MIHDSWFMSIILAKLFGSADKLKIVRLFLLNSEVVFASKEIARRAKVTDGSVRRQVNLLFKIGFICKRKKTETNKRKEKRRIEGWKLDLNFPLLTPLKNLVLDTTPISRKEILKKLSRAGRLKLVILTGIFIHKESSRLDILIVGEKISRGIVEKVLKEIEAQVGKELVFAVLSTKDFNYRLNIYDKFVRDVLDYPHQKIMDKIGI